MAAVVRVVIKPHVKSIGRNDFDLTMEVGAVLVKAYPPLVFLGLDPVPGSQVDTPFSYYLRRKQGRRWYLLEVLYKASDF